jgi:indolepyruvate ferredoxin oxidoreductase
MAADNRAAFEWGRWAAHDPAAVTARLDEATTGLGTDGGSISDPSAAAVRAARPLVAARAVPAALGDLVTRRTAQVIDYQSAVLARRFLGLVERAAARDDAGHGWELTRAVTESWFKLLTYKDEYEVARLHLRVDYDVVARELGITGPYKVTYHLHPPTLRRLGMSRKLPLGKPYELGFRGLRRMKRLRGTPLDLFGYDRDRRLERAVAAEYSRLMEDGLGRIDALGYETLTRLAASVMQIKGYVGIKEEAVARWRAQIDELTRAPEPVDSVSPAPDD